MFQEFWQQLRQQVWNPCACVKMHSLHMFAENSWMKDASTNQTCAAEQFANADVVPES